MNARVFLLVLVTAAFMAIWDADRPTELRQVVARSDAANATTSVENSHASTPVENAAKRNGDENIAAIPQTTVHDETLIPLPKCLPTGTWHAFNHEGDTIRITIERRSIPPRVTVSNAVPTTETSSESCVITGSDGVRWCFVKEDAVAK
jgi:hypothetical protein